MTVCIQNQKVFPIQNYKAIYTTVYVSNQTNYKSEPTEVLLSGKLCIPLTLANFQVKFIYSEKTTKFFEIFTLLLSYVVPVKSKVKISQNFVAFSEYMNFTKTG